jgi:hypothetical protein
MSKIAPTRIPQPIMAPNNVVLVLKSKLPQLTRQFQYQSSHKVLFLKLKNINRFFTAINLKYNVCAKITAAASATRKKR